MDLTQVTLTQMRYAVAVHDARNFRRAAEHCHVSQSGLSMQLQKLEDLLGTILFDRSKKPVLVTTEGLAVLDQMRTVLRETERLGLIAAENDELRGPYRLGVIPTLSASVVPLFLRGFVEAHPHVELAVEELQTEDMIARLRADTLDAGIAATPLSMPELHEETLGLEPLYAYLPKGDALLRKKSLAQSDLAMRELWIMPEGHCFRSQVLSYCNTSRPPAPARVRFESGSFETLVRLVDVGLGATVLPSLVVSTLSRTQQKRVRPLTAPPPVREIGLVRARTHYRKAVSAALTVAVRDALTQRLAPAPRRARVLDPMSGPALPG